MKRLGKRILCLEEVAVGGFASMVGQKEKEGPLGQDFDLFETDPFFGMDSFEQGESRMVERTVEELMRKTNRISEEIDYIFAGDLLNQCVSTTFGLKEQKIPYVGLYGACSTMAESMALAAIFVESKAAQRALAVTSSHFCTAERQYRFPLEYGGQRPPTAQWTVTGAGAVMLEQKNEKNRVMVSRICMGQILDLGVTDANNMGAAMAPAATDTIATFFSQTGERPENYDAIVTGDLGREGSLLLQRLLDRERIDLRHVHQDCGQLIFDPETQDTHSGGSGCGCSASVLCSHFLPRLTQGTMKRILFVATGALMSPTTVQQKKSIPGVAHLLELTVRED